MIKIQTHAVIPEHSAVLTTDVGLYQAFIREKDLNKIFFNVYLFLRERERQRQSVSRGGAQRERDMESEAGSSSKLSAQSLTWGSNS